MIFVVLVAILDVLVAIFVVLVAIFDVFVPTVLTSETLLNVRFVGDKIDVFVPSYRVKVDAEPFTKTVLNVKLLNTKVVNPKLELAVELCILNPFRENEPTFPELDSVK